MLPISKPRVFVDFWQAVSAKVEEMSYVVMQLAQQSWDKVS